ncbi:MAG: hypothetical protein ACXVK4_06445 [Acidimicrobiia bacterium]
MRTRQLVALLRLLVVGLAAAACGSGGGTVPTVHVPTDAATLVFRVDTRGGYTSLEYQLGVVPQVSVFGDGRVVVAGPVTEQYPPHALPNLLTGTMTRAGVEDLAATAARLDLLRPRSFGTPGVSDQATTTVTMNVGGTHRLRVYAAQFEPVAGDPNVGPDQRAARRQVSRFLHAIETATNRVATHPYVATEVAVYVHAGTVDRPDTGGVTPGHADWPLGDLATLGTPTAAGNGYRCAVLSGPDATTALAAAADASAITRWRSNGAEHTIVWRPLLPDEHACPAAP